MRWKTRHHKKYGDICICICHVQGLEGFFHCWDGGCCKYENHQYLIPEKEINKENVLAGYPRGEDIDNMTIDIDAYKEAVTSKERGRVKNRRKARVKG